MRLFGGGREEATFASNLSKQISMAAFSFPSDASARDWFVYYVDVVKGAVYPAEVLVKDGRVASVKPTTGTPKMWMIPGLVDAHVHIESSMLPPENFAAAAVVHGTAATVSDPHEIANVLGVEGVDYMVASARKVPLSFNFGAPSCVPATDFETAGARLDASAVERLLDRPEIRYLSEMMNFPGVLHADPEVMRKIAAAKARRKPIDGHAPGLRGEQLAAYVAAGITTDHESFSYDEGREKIERGMKVIIREGSAARNFDALIPLLGEAPDMVMFCTDDLHPDDLLKGHINLHMRRALAEGFDPVEVVRAATLRPVQHYGLDHGLAQPGDPATFALLSSLDARFEVLALYVEGRLAAREGRSMVAGGEPAVVNQFVARRFSAEAFEVKAEGERLRIIEAYDGQLVTGEVWDSPRIDHGMVVSDPESDILKIVVVNRYGDAPPAVGFIRGIGLRRGAIASSVAHDSHNVVAVGADDRSLAAAVNAVMEARGGLAYADEGRREVLPLPIAGLMSNQPAEQVAAAYERLTRTARNAGSPLRAPFMTLSFMALLVIPQLKLGDRGLFDGRTFRFVSLWK